MKKTILGIFILVISTLVSCKVDVDATTDTNTVEFSIKTEDGGDSLAKGATVLIYSSEEAYNTAYANYDTSGSTAAFKGKAVDGKFLQDLNSKKIYWVRIIYAKQSSDSLLSGKYLYSNDEMGVQFGPFESNNFDGTKITTKATVTLSKAYSFLVVAAKDNSNISIEVYNSIGTKYMSLNNSNKLINNSITDINSLPDSKSNINKYSSKYLVYVVPRGKINIYYKNSLGCITTIEKRISGGGTVVKDVLEPCTNGSIVFYNKTSKLSDIKIILFNPSDTVATISGQTSVIPNCGSVNSNSFVTISRPLGVYYYVATSKLGNCEVSDIITLDKIGQCVPVEIKMCK